MNRRSFLRSLGVLLVAPATLVRATGAKPLTPDERWWQMMQKIAPQIISPESLKSEELVACQEHYSSIDKGVDGPLRRIREWRLIKDHPDYDDVDKWRIANGHYPYRARYDFIYESS